MTCKDHVAKNMLQRTLCNAIFDDALLKDPDPAGRGAADMFLHEVATTHARELSTWLGTRNDWSRQWIRATDMSDMTLRLPPDLARELIREMRARLGWTLVEVGQRIASAPRMTVMPAH